MGVEMELIDLTTGLHELGTFLKVFDNFAKNSTFTEHLDYANGIISLISMQSAKVDKLIEIAEKLEDELK